MPGTGSTTWEVCLSLPSLILDLTRASDTGPLRYDHARFEFVLS